MKNLGEELIRGMKEAVSYMRSKKKAHAVVHKVAVPEEIDVRALRLNLHLSRVKFAAKYGFSVRTLQHWEQGDRKPQGAARILLTVLSKNPRAVERALRSAE